jgi:hypothetical protein
MVEKIHEAVLKATEKDVAMAEQEWKRSSREEGLAQFSATPSIDLRPAGDGVDAVVRYVTRAGSRLETRNKMFRLVVDLMRGGRVSEEAGDKSLLQPQS